MTPLPLTPPCSPGSRSAGWSENSPATSHDNISGTLLDFMVILFLDSNTSFRKAVKIAFCHETYGFRFKNNIFPVEVKNVLSSPCGSCLASG